MNTYDITLKNGILIFGRNHGDCYGGYRKIHLDTEGKTGAELFKHIKNHAGLAPAKAAKQQGFCG